MTYQTNLWLNLIPSYWLSDWKYVGFFIIFRKKLRLFFVILHFPEMMYLIRVYFSYLIVFSSYFLWPAILYFHDLLIFRFSKHLKVVLWFNKPFNLSKKRITYFRKPKKMGIDPRCLEKIILVINIYYKLKKENRKLATI